MIRGCNNQTDAVAVAVAAVDAVGEEEMAVVAVVAVVDAVVVEDTVEAAVEDRVAEEADRGVLARTSRSSRE